MAGPTFAPIPSSYGGAAGVEGTSTIWLLLTAFLIFFFQLGSVLITNAKNKSYGNYGLKVLINMSVSMICWYLTGYAFAYGQSEDNRLRNKFIGNYNFALTGYREEDKAGPFYGLPFFFHTWTKALVVNTIISNSIGGRGTVLAHVLTTVYVTLFLYPVVTHWVQASNGWLSYIKNGDLLGGTGAIDFGAAGPVHIFAGAVSAASTIHTMNTTELPIAEDPDSGLLTLGTFINLIAYYAYISSASINPGFTTAYAQAAGRAAINLTLIMASCMLTTLLAENALTKELKLVHATNAITIAWVSIASNCLTAEPWAALGAGFVAAAIYVSLRRVFKPLQDNDTFVIHYVGGWWSLMFTGILANPTNIRNLIVNAWYGGLALNAKGDLYNPKYKLGQKGIFYPSGGVNGRLLGLLWLEWLVITGWALLMAVPLFIILHFTGKLVEHDSKKEKVPKAVEEAPPAPEGAAAGEAVPEGQSGEEMSKPAEV